MTETKIDKAFNLLKTMYNKRDDEFLFLKLYENSLSVHKKFPPNHTYNTLENFDKLLINLSEEYIETEEEIKRCLYNTKKENNNDLFYEIADVICYTSTIIMILYTSKEIENCSSISYSMLVESISNTIFPEFSNGNFYMDLSVIRNSIKPISERLTDLFKEQYFENIKIRRNWSNRKWHKPEPVDIEKDSKTITKLIFCNNRYLLEYIKILSVLVTTDSKTCSNLRDVFKYMYNKQEIILNLNS